MKKTILIVVFSLLSLTSCSSQVAQTSITKEDTSKLYPSSNTVIPHHSDWTKTHYKERIAEFKANPLELGDIVFIGNSITEQGSDWAEKFDNAKVKNRGIAGDVTAGVIARLKEIYYYKPEKVFLKIGINDLFHSDLNPEYVANNIKLIVAMIHQESPKTHYKERIAEFKANPIEFGDIVFIGNSITEQGGDWAEKFDNAKVKNRGIAGDVTAGVIARLKEIYYYKPEKVFLKIGINDLFHSDLNPEYVANNIKLIVAMIHQESPKTKIFVQTILPTRDNNPSKERIEATNAILKAMTPTDFLQVIDLHSVFANKDDLLISEYTHDGLHLTEAGYTVWQNYIKEFVNEGKITSYIKKEIQTTQKPTVTFTSAIPESIGVGTVLKVNFKYTSAKEINIYSGISLLNDWTWVSFVSGEGKKFPAGIDVEGSFDILIPKGTKPSTDLKDKMNYKINIEMKSLPDFTWIAGDYPASSLNFVKTK